eukprot:scaffold614_cov367-Prasinococcus_capsulatus_cf.AAC.18
MSIHSTPPVCGHPGPEAPERHLVEGEGASLRRLDGEGEKKGKRPEDEWGSVFVRSWDGSGPGSEQPASVGSRARPLARGHMSLPGCARTRRLRARARAPTARRGVQGWAQRGAADDGAAVRGAGRGAAAPVTSTQPRGGATTLLHGPHFACSGCATAPSLLRRAHSAQRVQEPTRGR